MDLTNRCFRRANTNWKLPKSRTTRMNQIPLAAATVVAVAGASEEDDDDCNHNHQGDNKQQEPSARKKPPPSQTAAICMNATSTGKENHHDQAHQMDRSSPPFAKDQQQQQQQCHACNRSLAKSRHLVSVAGKSNQWHSECFRCNICQKSLDQEESCHTYRDKILCREDYLKLQRNLTAKCSRCHWPIGANDWVRRASQYVYHLACFSCDICQRQLSTGEQFTIRVQKKNVVRLLCRLHFAIDQVAKCQQQQQKATARGPNDLVEDTVEPTECVLDFINLTTQTFEQQQQQQQQQADDRYLHLLASTSGQQPGVCLLDEEQNPAGCHGPIGDLAPSGPFKADQFQSLDRSHHNHNHHNNNHHHHHHHQLDHRQNNDTASSIASSESSSTSGGNSGTGAGLGNCHNTLASLASKSKRVRTTFTEDQLSILQNHFQIDSNPDGQDLERIAVITGLTKRVTQVWFQNSRARQKKYMTKRKPNGNLQPGSTSSQQNPMACTEKLSSQHYLEQRHQLQRIDPSIGGECCAKMTGLDPVGVAARKWINSAANLHGCDERMSPSMSSRESSRQHLDDVDETRSSTLDDNDALMMTGEDRSTEDSTNL